MSVARKSRERNIRVRYLRKYNIELDEYLDSLDDELAKVEEREYMQRELRKHEQLKALKVA